MSLFQEKKQFFKKLIRRILYMKQRYTLTVANSQINIVTEMSQEEIDAILGIVDRRIREIHLHSKSCSRTDAAILLCLDYCAEKIELQKTIKTSNNQIERLSLLNESQEKEIAALKREIETLRTSMGLVATAKPVVKKHVEEQIAIDEINHEAQKDEAEAPANTAIDKILAQKDEPTEEENIVPVVEEKLHAKARKKKVRAMFDMISFDDI